MSTNKQTFKPNRRAFLQRVTVGGGAAGLLLGTGFSFSAEAAEEEHVRNAPTAPEAAHSSGYRLTEHIREYYRKAAF